jgi:hypothetical protein
MLELLLRRSSTLYFSSLVNALPGCEQLDKVFLRHLKRSSQRSCCDSSIGLPKNGSLSFRVKEDDDTPVRVLDVDMRRFVIAREHREAEASRNQYGRH